eukprot:scaffold122011_cov63-Phaeocystis_antarctica.AAC.2
MHEAAVVALPARRAVALAPAVPRLALADAPRAAAVAHAVAWTGRVDQSAVGACKARVAHARCDALVARPMARAVARADTDDAVTRVAEVAFPAEAEAVDALAVPAAVLLAHLHHLPRVPRASVVRRGGGACGACGACG